jgi:hypothetical protein
VICAQRVLRLLRTYRALTHSQLVELTGCSDDAVEWALRSLKRAGCIHQPRGKATAYLFIHDNYPGDRRGIHMRLPEYRALTAHARAHLGKLGTAVLFTVHRPSVAQAPPRLDWSVFVVQLGGPDMACKGKKGKGKGKGDRK